MTPEEFRAAREAFHTQWGEVLRDLKGEIKRAAATERAYRKREAELWVQAPKGEKRGDVTAAERDAWVSGESSDLRYERDIALALLAEHRWINGASYSAFMWDSTWGATALGAGRLPDRGSLALVRSRMPRRLAQWKRKQARKARAS